MMDIEGNLTRQLQMKELEILTYFKEICRKNNLRFYLCGGCLIGALRHKGFIPWDDDVDIFMPRPDYERLAREWKKIADTSRYVYCRTGRKHIYHDAGASIRDINTTFINEHSKNDDICQGIPIEIMPIDGCPDGKIARLQQLFFAMIFSLFNVQRLPDNKGKLIRGLSKFLYFIVPSKQIRYRIWKYAQHQMTRYRWEDCHKVTELIGSLKGMLLEHPKRDFEQAVEVDFEGQKMPVMRGYDRYMRLIWGDYMALPPKEQQVAKHSVVYVDLNHSYKKYKGIYYCRNEK